MTDTTKMLDYVDGIIHLRLELKYRVGPEESRKLLMEYVDALCTEGRDVKTYGEKKGNLILALRKPELSLQEYEKFR